MGYKKTSIGLIPESWGIKTLAQVCTKITDGTHDTPTPARTGTPFLTAIHVKENFINFENCLYLNERDHRIIFARCNPHRGDVLMVNIGAGVATTAPVNVDFEFSLKNVALLKPDPSRIIGAYLNQFIINRKPSITKALLSGGAQPFLSLSQIGQVEIALPSLGEQIAIANALGDADALITALDRLIAKKRDIKKATLQQLLTGKTRLPGFSGAWEQTQMRDLITRLKKTSRLSASGKDEGIYPFFTNTTKPVERFLDESDFETEAIIANTGGEAYFNYYKGRFAAMSDCLVFESKVDTRFLYYLLKLSEHNINSNGFTGSGIKHLDKKYFEQIEVCYPVQAQEQTAIANVLSDIDSEISALEARRDKTRALKQGMMQELLTGKTRLI